MSTIEVGSLDSTVTAGYQWSREVPGTRVLAPLLSFSIDAWQREMGIERFLKSPTAAQRRAGVVF